MEILVVVSRNRKCGASIDYEYKPYTLAWWRLSFGDLTRPNCDCEVLLTPAQINELRDKLNKLELKEEKVDQKDIKSELACVGGLDILVQAIGSMGISAYKEDGIWKLMFIASRSISGGSITEREEQSYSIKVIVECYPFQLAELRGILNGLKAEQDREEKVRRDEEEKRKKEQEKKKKEPANVTTAKHYGFC